MSESTLPLTGGCMCGGVRFEVSEPLLGALYCHCKLRMGSMDEDPGIRPGAHQFTDYAAPWDPIPDDGLPRFRSGSRRMSRGRSAWSMRSAAGSTSLALAQLPPQRRPHVLRDQLQVQWVGPRGFESMMQVEVAGALVQGMDQHHANPNLRRHRQ